MDYVCGLGSAVMGRLVHQMIRMMGLEGDMFVGSSLIKLYAENACIDDARLLFDIMPNRDCVLWNVMIYGYLKNEDYINAIEVFLEMRKSGTKPNSVTFVSTLSVCATEGIIRLGTQLHGLSVIFGFETDPPVANTLVSVYSKCKHFIDARRVFETMPRTDVVLWNAIISGYVQNGMMEQALDLFNEMIDLGIKPDSVTFSSLLPSIAESTILELGKEAHGYIVRHGVPLDVFLKSALIDLYFKCKDVKMAKRTFEQTSLTDIVIYTGMISGYVLNGMNMDAVETFRKLMDEGKRPNSLTLASLLPACAGLASPRLGKEVHGFALKNGIESRCYVGSAILDMYAKCGRVNLAHNVFKNMSQRDSVCWNSMITGYSQNGKPQEAIHLFRQMGAAQGIKYDCVSVTSALSACASLPALYYGKEIHGYMIKQPSCSDIFGKSTLIDMYAKCGNLELARRVFDQAEEKNEVSWNSIIAAYGMHGLLSECLSLFHKMLENYIRPDYVTFLTIISACGHVGEIDQGIRYFHLMRDKYRILPRMEHYGCMVDLFGRAGRLKEAFETIKSMPFPPDAGVWGTLLGACRVHGNVDLAEIASSHLFDLDPENSGYYTLLSNVHADAGQWIGVHRVRHLMKERGLQKIPGRSWVEIDNVTHIFVAADWTHPQSGEIYFALDILLQELRREGYAPQLCHLRNPQAEEII
ncbi:pentatricopeptide repeat-containing protein At4g21300 isoform X2 [Punica granatum]|uniref:Pentatricopeptide repeat-containing protein At4g21300 isoform X2 n=1 Tax=Punica granatum TaxID=22663 RepID=A0A6P8BP22_PUNGR|nr:pentatricopeptide repeat-containing protein At4g21300 isoform X2 [Punica granatum]